MTRERPLRLGFFTYLDDPGPHAEGYQKVIDAFQLADKKGFDTAWVAQHHFGHHGGLPSPFVFFAALAERTRQIGLGTAIIALPLEHPIRVAEDAALFETLHPGRLQLGVGTGNYGENVLAAFGHAGKDRRAMYQESLAVLQSAFEGQPLDDDGDTLYPPAPQLRHRIWESPASLERVAETARRGNGLLLSRIAIGGGNRPSPEIQVPLVERYLAELPPGVEPRLGFSRTVFPTSDADSARRSLTRGLQAIVEQRSAQGQPDDGLSMEERFRLNNIHMGSPDEVIESLMNEPLLEVVTDLICQVSPGLPSQEQTLEAIELLADKVAPALGWQPAAAMAAVR